jgi:hypothetical protein
MDVDILWRQSARGHYIIEVWSRPVKKLSGTDSTVPLDEDMYLEINQWCIDSFGYHARTAYHIFELKTRPHLDWFILRWQ